MANSRNLPQKAVESTAPVGKTSLAQQSKRKATTKPLRAVRRDEIGRALTTNGQNRCFILELACEPKNKSISAIF
jgi:hypothetical protein